MASFNSGYIFNANGSEGGFFWNGASFTLLINLHETFGCKDNIKEQIVNLILSERSTSVYDAILQMALYHETELFDGIESVTYTRLFEVFDSFGIADELNNLIVLSYLTEKLSLIEDIKTLANILTYDKIEIEDGASLQTFLNMIDSFGLKDLGASLGAIINAYDSFNATDKNPRTAISDFIIGNTGDYDTAYEWLLPFGIKIDKNSSTIQVMPEAEHTAIEMPGVDGSIIEDTVYKDRAFQIVGYSEIGLTIAEKEELKTKIAQILDSTKHQSKKLTVQRSDISFDVRYDGLANIEDGPSFVKATIPFRTTPYGYSLFDQETTGTGLVFNDGDVPVGVKHTIKGPFNNPAFTLNNIQYKWNGDIPNGYSLVIDHGLMTCYLIDGNGNKSNALANLTGKFQKVPARSSVVITAENGLGNQLITSWKNRLLWSNPLQGMNLLTEN